MEDNVSWPPHSNDRFLIWKHLLNHICVTEALNRPQKPPIMVVYHGKFSQQYIQYPVWARPYVQSPPSLVFIPFNQSFNRASRIHFDQWKTSWYQEGKMMTWHVELVASPLWWLSSFMVFRWYLLGQYLKNIM